MNKAEQYIMDYLDGRLDQKRLSQLEAWIQKDSKHAEQFMWYSFMHSGIRDCLKLSRLQKKVGQSTISKDIQESSVPKRGSKRWLAMPVVWAAMAACLLIGLGLGVVLTARPSSKPTVPVAAPPTSEDKAALAQSKFPTSHPKPVARLMRAEQAKWKQGNLQVFPQLGQSLGAQTLELLDGVAELELASGVTVALQAPAIIDLQKSQQVYLYRGLLQADVPEKAKGFTVKTPSATIVDLGTSFGIDAAEDGQTEVHVLKGEVEATARQTAAKPIKPQKLTKGHARRMRRDSETVETIKFQAARFRRIRKAISDRPKVEGALQYIPVPPKTLEKDHLQHKWLGRVILERTGVVLPEALSVLSAQEDDPIKFESAKNFLTILDKGKRVDSFLVHYDIPLTKGKTTRIEGQITFARPIVGIIGRREKLIQTDKWFGVRGTTYSQHRVRGLIAEEGLNPVDMYQIKNDGRTIAFRLMAADLDEFRILVKAESEK